MHYIDEISFAAEKLFEGIFHEQEYLQTLIQKLRGLKAEINRLYQVSNFSALNPDLDDEGLGTASYWEAYFEKEPELDKVAKEVDDLKNRIESRTTARASLAAALLQIAKQGISMVHGTAPGPSGRSIGSLTLRTLIWEARNQSMHYEGGSVHPPVRACFETLAAETGKSTLRDYNVRNLAYEVIEVLGWHSLADFKADLTT